jgi:hypothetical protein
MTNYHHKAVLMAIRQVQLSGEPARIGSAYANRLPFNVTLDGLVRQAGLTLTICKSSGCAIISKTFWRNT